MSAFGPGYAAPPSAQLVYGGFWLRFLAYLIDGFILGALDMLMFSAVGVSFSDLSSQPVETPVGPILTLSGLSVLIPIIYTVGFWVSSGATPGKLAFGLRVVSSDTGGPISTGQAIGRFFGYFLSYFVLSLGFIWAAFDSRKQAWHDKLAGTVVVHRVEVAPVFRT